MSGKSGALIPPSCPTEGRFAIVTDAGRDAVDAAALVTSSANADGKAVWSWRPDAGAKCRGVFRDTTVARKPGHRGERGISRKPLRRESRMPPLDLYARVRFPCAFCTRDRGCSAHPAFPAPSDFLGRRFLAKPGRNAPRDRGGVSDEYQRATRSIVVAREGGRSRIPRR
jgi:hypothetical protein